MVLEAQEERPGALVPERLHDERERAVAARLGDAQVKKAVGGKRHRAAAAVLVHLVERLLHRADLRLGRLLRGERSALCLDQPTRADELEGPRVRGQRLGRRARAGTDHVDAGTDAHLDIAFDLQRDQRFPHRGAAHTELPGEVALGRQARAHAVLATIDERRDLVGDLAVESAILDGLEGHLVKWSGQFKRELSVKRG